MNIAIPIHKNRVMPRFGCTREMIIVTIENEKITSQKRRMLTRETFLSFPSLLRSEQVSLIICGGIHPRFQQILRKQDIRIVWGVVGGWQEVLQAYLEGNLQTDPTFCSSQDRRKGRRFRRGHEEGGNYART